MQFRLLDSRYKNTDSIYVLEVLNVHVNESKKEIYLF